MSAENMQEICPECKKGKIVYDGDHWEYVCNRCGYVADDTVIDDTPVFVPYEKESEKERKSKGKKKRTPMEIRRGQLLKKNIFFSGRPRGLERNYYNASKKLSAMEWQLNLDQATIKEVDGCYRKALGNRLVMGRTIETVVAACIYIVSRQRDNAIPLDVIASKCKASRRDVGRTCRFIASKLRVKLDPIQPQDYVPRFCSQLSLGCRVQGRSAEILREAERCNLVSGRTPSGLAAAAIYLASIECNEKRTQREVAKATFVDEATIRTRAKEFEIVLGETVQYEISLPHKTWAPESESTPVYGDRKRTVRCESERFGTSQDTASV